MDITKQVIPIGAALAVGYLLCTLTYNAGSKVSTNDTQIASLAARLDGVVQGAADAAKNARDDHDRLIKLESEDTNLDRGLTMLESRIQNQPPVRFDVGTTASK